MRTELRYIIVSPYFYIGIILTFLLCFTEETYAGGESFSQVLLQILPRLDKNTIDIELLNPCILIQDAATGYLSLFAPVVTAIPYIISHSKEKRSRYKYYKLSRISLKSYYRSQWFAGVLGGGIMMLAGCLLFHLCLLIFFPQLGSGSGYLYSIGITGSMQILFYIQIYMGFFFYGMLCVIPAIILSAFCSNLYFLICIPFLGSFFWNLLINRLSEWAIYSDKGTLINLTAINYLYPTSIIYGFTSVSEFFPAAIQIAGCLLLLSSLYHILIFHTIDIGE